MTTSLTFTEYVQPDLIPFRFFVHSSSNDFWNVKKSGDLEKYESEMNMFLTLGPDE
jgi:hypothetical protein